MPVIRKLLRVLAHRTPTHGRCYGQTAAGGCNAGQSDPRDGSAADAYHERPVSDRLSPRAPDRAPTRVDPASPRAVLDGRDSARAGGVEPGIGRHDRPAGADVPAHRGDPRGVLSTLPGSAAGLLRGGVRPLHRPPGGGGPPALCRGRGPGARPLHRHPAAGRLAAGRDCPSAEAALARARGGAARLPPGRLRSGPGAVPPAALLGRCGGQRDDAREDRPARRRPRHLSLHRLQRLSKRRHGGGCLEDWLVRAGSGVSAPPQLVRYIRWRAGGTRYELLTNVLAPARLAAAEALALYPYRWRIERMYYDLKEVLNLNRIYAANPNAVAMQVYAAGIVYNALRVAQGDVAAAAGLEPEEISPAKFFPKMVAACQTYVVAQQWERRVRRLNPHRRLRMLDWRTERWASVSVPLLHVEARSETRRHRRYCPARRHWKSLAHVPGGRRFTKLS